MGVLPLTAYTTVKCELKSTMVYYGQAYPAGMSVVS